MNVYPSGRVVCLGSKSVERARADARAVLRRLGVSSGEADASAAVAAAAMGNDGGEGGAAAVRYVVMSGWMFGGHDAYRAIPLLRERYEVTLDSDVFSGYFVRSRMSKGAGDDDEDDGSGSGSGGVSIQVFVPDAAANAGTGGAGSDGTASSGGKIPLLCRGPTVRDICAVVGDVYRMVAGGAGDRPGA